MSDTYYDIGPILKIPARYRMMFGERSNGKTYAVLEHHMKEYIKDGGELAIIRRYADDFVGAQSARSIFDSLICNGELIMEQRRVKGEREIIENARRVCNKLYK